MATFQAVLAALFRRSWPAYTSLGMVDHPYGLLDNLDPASTLVPTD